jgi:hypothetical protein
MKMTTCKSAVAAVGCLAFSALAAYCLWNTQTVLYRSRGCSDTNAFCTYYRYEPSWVQCLYCADGTGTLANCISTNQDTPYQMIVQGICDGTNCSGGSATASWGTNNNSVMIFTEDCDSGG